MKPVYVCLPVYNGAASIDTTLRNIFQQEHRDFEIIVYDDGSTDQTAEIVHDIARSESRVRLVDGKTNHGRGYARNRLIEHAAGGIVAWQDADDGWHPAKLGHQLGAMEQFANQNGTDQFLLISTFERLSVSGNKVVRDVCIPPSKYDLSFILGPHYGRCPFQLQAVIGPAAVFEQAGGFDDNLNWAEDIDIAMKVLSAGYRIRGDRSKLELASYNYSLDKVQGPLVEAAQNVIRDRFRDFAARNGYDLDAVFRRRGANYLARVYLQNGQYDKALQLNLQALASIDPSDDAEVKAIAANILRITSKHARKFFKPPEPVATRRASAPEREARDTGYYVRKVVGAAARTLDLRFFYQICRAGLAELADGKGKKTIPLLHRAVLSAERGARMQILPPPDFNEDVYLSENPDVSYAVERGVISCGFAHYVRHGQWESRYRPSR